MNRPAWVLLVSLFASVSEAQLLTPKEEKIDSLIMKYVEQNQVVPEIEYFQKSNWKSLDALGVRTLTFSGGKKYKLTSNGSGGKYQKEQGSWYIYDKYIVLETRKGKIPVYVIRHKKKTILLDQENLDIMKKLIRSFVAGDQWMGYLTEEDVLGFLNGFEKYDS